MAQGKKLNCRLVSNEIEYQITTKHPIYRLRYTIMTRCYNASPDDALYYQDRNIKVCEEWINNPQSFFQWCLDNEWRKGMALDRIDPDKNYEPGNCQFITKSANLKKMHKQRNLLGENAAHAKLTLEQVNEIRKRLSLGITAVRIAKDFNVSPSTIGAIKRKQNWKEFV